MGPKAPPGPGMLKASEDETETVREYFEWQAPDLEVIFMQKVYSEAVMNTRHDVWGLCQTKIHARLTRAL